MIRPLLLLLTAALCGCFDDKPLPPGCEEGSLCIREMHPGRAFVVGGANATFSDVHLTASGTALVVSHGAGEIWVSRSPDNGRSWRTTNLGSSGQCTGGDDRLVGGRAFTIGDGRIGVSGTQSECAPKEAFLRYSNDGGLSYSSWINISDSSDLAGTKDSLLVIRSKDRYVALFFEQYLRFRSSSRADLGDWNGSKRGEIDEGNEKGEHFDLAYSEREEHLYAIVFKGSARKFMLYRSKDGESFDRHSEHVVSQPLKRGALWIDPVSGYFYVCGVATPKDTNVYTMYSTNEGKEWSEPELYLEGLSPTDTVDEVTCDVGPSGVTVGYRDALTGYTKVILPQAPPTAEVLGCSDWKSVEREASYCDNEDASAKTVRCNMVRCDAISVYDQGICAFGWHICNHTEFLSALANANAGAPQKRYWLNAYVRDKTVVDNPDPGCFDYQATDKSVQAVTDINNDTGSPYVDAGDNMDSAGACETVKADGAMCCRGL